MGVVIPQRWWVALVRSAYFLKDTLVCTNQHSSGTSKLQRSSKVLQGACKLHGYKVGGLSGNIKKDYLHWEKMNFFQIICLYFLFINAMKRLLPFQKHVLSSTYRVKKICYLLYIHTLQNLQNILERFKKI